METTTTPRDPTRCIGSPIHPRAPACAAAIRVRSTPAVTIANADAAWAPFAHAAIDQAHRAVDELLVDD